MNYVLDWRTIRRNCKYGQPVVDFRYCNKRKGEFDECEQANCPILKGKKKAESK